nr:MAG TPA: Kringle domain [Caudoviricetes sp.]
MRNIFAEVVFSKVDTDNNFCRNPFSKVDTMIRSLVMSLFARDSSFG